MAMTINTNVMSLNAQRNLSNTSGALSTAMQRLSSGLRVNSAKDDAAGLAIAERFNAQARGMNVAIRNANDAISLSQTAEGALGKIVDSLQRMRELAVQSANATNTSADRDSLNSEFEQLQSEIDRVVGATKFNGTALLTATSPFEFQVGAGTSTDDRVSITTTDLTSGALADAIAGTVTIDGATNANSLTAIDAVDSALTLVNTERATFGAAQNRFEAVISNLQVASENAQAARGRIIDADFASETANLSRAQILQQAGSAMVAQANQQPQQVLALLRNF